MTEIQIYPLMGLCFGAEYLNDFEAGTMKSVDVYIGILGISFRWV